MNAQLLHAARVGNVDGVLWCVGNDVDVETEDEDGMSPLLLACLHGHTQVVEKLTSTGADSRRTTRAGRSGLHLAAAGGHLEVVQLLLDAGVDALATDHTGQTPRDLAEQHGHDVVAMVLAMYEESRGVFSRAIDRGQFQGISRFIDSRLYEEGPGGRTLLHVAAAKGELDTAVLLVDQGANVQVCDDNGWTPLHFACESGNPHLVEVLLAGGAKANVMDDDGLAPVDVAAMHGHLEAVGVLLTEGVGLKSVSHDGMTLLHRAAMSNNTTLVDFILSHQALDVNAVDYEGRTALHCAVTLGCSQVISSLVSAGADVHATVKSPDTSEAESALQMAVRLGHVDATRQLLQFRARIHDVLCRDRNLLNVTESVHVRGVLLEHCYALYYERCLKLLSDTCNEVSSRQLTELVPLITSVHDLRLLIALIATNENLSDGSEVLKVAFEHVVSTKLVFDYDACAYFKLILEHCERKGWLSRFEVHYFDRLAENVNAENTEWVNELKRQVAANSWRLEKHENHFAMVVTGLKQVHSMVLENRAVLKAVTTRMSNLQAQVHMGKQLLGQLISRTQRINSQASRMQIRLIENERQLAQVCRQTNHLTERAASLQNQVNSGKRVLANVIAQSQRLASHVNRFERRIAQSERNLITVATSLQSFRESYANQMKTQKRNKQIKRICGVVSSVVGLMFGPALKDVVNAVVDFTNPVDFVEAVYGETDMANFLSLASNASLPDAVAERLQECGIPADEFEELLREEIAFQHPEYLAECEERLLTVFVDGGQADVACELEATINEEEAELSSMLQELEMTIDNQDPPGDEADLSCAEGEDFDVSTNQLEVMLELELRLGESAPEADDEVLRLRSPAVKQELNVQIDKELAIGSMLQHSGESEGRQGLRGREAPYMLDTRMETDNQTEARAPSPLEHRGSRSSTSSHPSVLVGDLDRHPFHRAVLQSQGDRRFYLEILRSSHENSTQAKNRLPVQVRRKRISLEKLTATAYAYCLGYTDIGDLLATRMRSRSSLNKSPANCVKFLQDVAAAEYFCAVQACLGDVGTFELFYSTVDSSKHSLATRLAAEVERDSLDTEYWTALELAVYHGYDDIAALLVTEVYRDLPAMEKFEMLRTAREHAKLKALNETPSSQSPVQRA